jgi:hypothetical protein
MSHRKRSQFGRVDDEPRSIRVLPHFCILLLLVAWVRYPAMDLVGFKVGEAILLSGFALSLLAVTSRPSVIAFLYGISMWLWGLLLFAESAMILQGINVQFLDPVMVAQFPPNAAATVASLGLGLSIVAKRRRRSFQGALALILATVALAVSGVAIWGHSSGIVGAYSWGRFEPLSASASALYFASAALLFVAARFAGEKEVALL